MPTRRDFLRFSCLSAPLWAGFPTLFARAARSATWAAEDRVLVLLRLGGGNDGLNTVIPVEDDAYQRARPTLRVAPQQALRLADDLALHPALTGLRELFAQGRVAIVHSVGYPEPDRSHFRSLDIWHSGTPDGPARHTGWLGRALDHRLAAAGAVAPALALTADELPLALVADRVVVPSIPSLEEFLVEDATLAGAAAAARPGAPPLLRHAVRAAAAGFQASARVAAAAGAVPFDDFPATRLGRSLATLLALLRSGIGTRVFYVAHDGFDTHTRQQENHATLLRDLDRGVAALFRALAVDGADRRVLLLTFSEFGRRLAENGSRGTDHGAAAPLFAVSGGLEPGAVGPPPDLTDLEDGDVRHRVDFRSVYATVLERWLDVDPAAVLGGSFPTLPFLRPRA